MSIPVDVSAACPNCNVEDDYCVATTIDEITEHSVRCEICGHDFEVAVLLELDSWTK
jgi:transcription elongation factor Elf1